MSPGRRDRLAAFYTERAGELRAVVAGQVRTADHTIVDDACQHGWLTLARRDDVTLDDRGAAWLATVAIREGWRLARVPRAVPSGMFRGGGEVAEFECPEPASLEGDPEARLLAREVHDWRVAELSRLSALQLRDLLLHAAGLSYVEIATLSRGRAVVDVCSQRAHGDDMLSMAAAGRVGQLRFEPGAAANAAEDD